MSKFKSFMKKLKKNMLVCLVVWLIFAILLVPPVTYTITNGYLEGMNWMESMTYNFFDNLVKFPITEVFNEPYVADFIKGIEIFSILYLLIVFRGIYKSLPKSEYDKIEHGSSDWCNKGEQYKVLSKTHGLILAKDNYLPIDKSGNINVLIVGRIWCW